tara:strand:+ start:3088 stop:8541 length:5454 start_codon:yes stop_codon:yes gene_type:complete
VANSDNPKEDLFLNAAISVEAESEVEQVIEEDKEVDEKNFNLNHSAILDKQDFLRKIQAKNFKDLDDNEYPSLLESNNFWDAWIGGNNFFTAQAKYLGSDLCEFLLKHKDKFEYGLDLKHLPAGFFWRKSNSEQLLPDVLDYDKYYAEVQFRANKISKLAVNCDTESLDTIESIDLDIDSIIDDFDALNKSWWECLYDAHNKTVSSDLNNKKVLLISYLDFKDKLKNLNLTLPIIDSNHDFQDIKSLPVTLGRILAIIESCKVDDRQEQLNLIPKLDLKSNSVITIVNNNKNALEQKKCSFVFPSVVNNFSDCKLCAENKFIIRNITTHNTMNIYLSYQDKRRSIIFYNEAVNILQNTVFKDADIAENDKNFFYSMLAESTSGDQYLDISDKDALEYWQNICLAMKNVKLSTQIYWAAKAMVSNPNAHVKEEIIKTLYSVDCPNLVVLCKVVEHQKYWLSKMGLANASVLQNKITEFVDSLKALKDRKINYTEGYKFYLNENLITDDINDSVLFNYFSAQEKLAYNGNNEIFCAYFSTFNLLNDVDNVLEINLCLDNPINLGLMKTALSFFKDAKNNNNLNYTDLVIISSFAQGDIISLLEYLKMKYSQNFEEKYFDNKIYEIQNKHIISDKHKLEISNIVDLTDKQKEIILNILSESISIDFNNSRDLCLKYLLTIKNNITYSEFSDFLNNLDTVLKVYKSNNNDQNNIEENLLSILHDCTKIKKLCFFDQLFSHDELEQGYAKKDLLDKFAFYLTDVAVVLDNQNICNNLSKSEMQNLLSTVLLRSGVKDIKVLENLAKKIDKLASYNKQSIVLLRLFISNINHQDTEYLDNLNSIIDLLGINFEVLQQSPMIIHSLLFHFKDNPEELYNILLLFEQDNSISIDIKTFTLNILSFLIDNKQYNNINIIQEIEKFLLNIKTFQDIEFIKEIYTKPPYPSLEQINNWFDDSIHDKYKGFDLKPFGDRESSKFGFNFKDYKIQKEKFLKEGKGSVVKNVFNHQADIYFKKLNKIQQDLQSYSTNDLFTKILEIKKRNNPQELLPYVIEMLARTTHQKHPTEDNKIISQELNTTQIMAIYAIIVSNDKKIVSEILTGQGKSRITMVLAACLGLQGKTVDFMTSNMQLAQRDYLSYKAFFKSLGIEISLIFSNTKSDDYKIGGINFSDPTQISLARNKSMASGNIGAFGMNNRENQAQILDEFDVLAFDLSHLRYNFSEFAYELEAFNWIYSELNSFIADNYELSKKVFNLKVTDISELRKAFSMYVISNTGDLNRLGEFQKLYKENYAQIDIWLNSSWIASHLKKDRHFLVDEKSVPVMTTKGIRYSKQIKVLAEKRVAPFSTYAKGVHQCLCAMMNKEYKEKNPNIIKDPFCILPEKRITYTSGPSDLLDFSDEFYAVTGTKGDFNELYELYHEHNMVSLSVPCAQELKRCDHRVILSKDKSSQYKELLKYILKAQANNRPILIICEDDEKSAELYTFLKDHNILELQRVHAGFSYDQESKAIDRAGNNKSVTVSTAMMGRGTDINADDLLVVKMFLPNSRGANQIDGRSGRFGKLGDAVTILNKEEYNIPISYNHEQQLRLLQISKSKAVQKERFITGIYTKLKTKIEQEFFCNLFPYVHLSQKLEVLQRWQEHSKYLDEIWLDKKDNLLDLINDHNKEEFISQVNLFIEERLPDNLHADLMLKNINVDWMFNIDNLSLDNSHKEVKPQSYYEPGNAGQANVYSRLFSETIATLTGERKLFANFRAWLEDTGVLFADTRAVLNGDRAIFANTRQFIYEVYLSFVQLVQDLIEYLFSGNLSDIDSDQELESSAPSFAM